MGNSSIKEKKFFLVGIFSTLFLIYPNIAIKALHSSEGNILNIKCPSLKIKKFTYITFDKIDKSNLINLDNVDCQDVVLIDKLDSSKVNITTGRKSGKSVSCLSDSKSYPCKFVVGEFKTNIVPNVALKRIFNYEEPKPDFLNETSARIFINIYDIFEKEYRNIATTLIELNKDYNY